MNNILGNNKKSRSASALDLERIANKFNDLTFDEMNGVFDLIEEKANITIEFRQKKKGGN